MGMDTEFVLRRTRISIQVSLIAKEYNIPQTMVHEIINSYIAYCKEMLTNGNRVDFLGLVSIVPNYRASHYNTTLAYNCTVLAERLSLPYHSVYRIMEAYIADAINALYEGKTVEIRSLVTCSPIYSEGKLAGIHSHVSQSLKNCLTGSKVTSIRVHTCKDLREEVHKCVS